MNLEAKDIVEWESNMSLLPYQPTLSRPVSYLLLKLLLWLWHWVLGIAFGVVVFFSDLFEGWKVEFF